MEERQTDILRYALIEFLLNPSNHPSKHDSQFKQDLLTNWLNYGNMYFNAMTVYKSDDYNATTLYSQYYRWYKNHQKKQKLAKELVQWKDRINSEWQSWYTNPNDIVDLNIFRFETIGEWFCALQKAMLSAHMRERSDSFKGKHLDKLIEKEKQNKKQIQSRKRKFNKVENTVRVQNCKILSYSTDRTGLRLCIDFKLYL
eukprot:183074_1